MDLVVSYTYCRMMYGAYNVKMILDIFVPPYIISSLKVLYRFQNKITGIQIMAYKPRYIKT